MKRIFLGATAILLFATYVTAQNKVGIGTTTPIVKLHISSTDSAVMVLENTQALAADKKVAMYFKTGNAYTGGIQTIGTGSGTARLGLFTYAVTAPSFLKEQLTITDAGYTGIGTVDPQMPFHVSNSTSALALLENTQSLGAGVMAGLNFKTGTRYTGAIKTIGGNTAAARIGFFTYSDPLLSNLVERMSIQDNGLIGIGNTNPGLAGLVVDTKVGAANAVFGSNTTGVAIESSYPGIGFNSYYSNGRRAINAGYGSLVGQDPTTGRFYISTSATSVAGQGSPLNTIDRLTIKTDGNIGVQGNTDPQSPLSFANTLGEKMNFWNVDATNNYGIGIQGSLMQLYSGGNNADIVLGYGSSENFSENMRVKGNGNVGVGTNNPGAKLEVAGKIKATQRFFFDDAAVEISGAIKVSGSNKAAFQINMGTLAGNSNFFQIGTGANQIDYYRITTPMTLNDPDAIITVTPVSSRLSFPFWVGYDASNTVGGGSGQWYIAEPHNSSGVGGFIDGMRFNIMIMKQ